MSYNSGSNPLIVLVISNRPRSSRSSDFKSASLFALVRFWNYSRDYSLNCTPLGPITITKTNKILNQSARIFLRLFSKLLCCTCVAFSAFSFIIIDFPVIWVIIGKVARLNGESNWIQRLDPTFVFCNVWVMNVWTKWLVKVVLISLFWICHGLC